jgi:PAS domain S-box-containing protein
MRQNVTHSRTRRGRVHNAPKGLEATGTDAQPLISLVKQATSLTELLPHLHQRALAVSNGTCALLFVHNARTGAMHATSGYGLEAIPTDPWIPAPPETLLLKDAFSRSTPTLVTNAERQAPDLFARMDTASILLLPLLNGTERLGLLVIGLRRAPTGRDLTGDLSLVADGFVIALDLFRLRQNDALQRDIRALLDEFAGMLGATLNLSAGLDAFCRGANQLFGADRTSVWVYERRDRHLILRASSEFEHVARGARVAADDAGSPAASAMRRSHAELHPTEGTATATVTVPLRGCRRALGTLTFEGVRVEAGGEFALLDRADELGRQLSAAIENIQLLDDVVGSRNELENAFDSIAHLIVASDRQGRIVHANRAFANRLGMVRERLLDRPLRDFVGPELAAWLAMHTRAPHPGAPPATFETVDPVLKGPFMVTVTDLLDRNHEHVGAVLVARDLTPQAKLQAEREELRLRLTQSEKLAALGQFVAGIAHELNNPLQGVLGHLELLRVTGAFPKNLRREVHTIYREADRAAKIVRDLLVFSGSRRSLRRSVSLNAALQKVVALRARACRAAQIELVRRNDPSLPRVQSDPILLHQVFLNIVMNAEQAVVESGRPGRIEITTSVSPNGDRVVTSVRDTGNGIPAESLPRIFEPFYTTKEVGKGTGLGLAITYGIVQEHGGQIVASNHPDGGAVLTVDLPARQSASQKNETEPMANAG